MFQRILVANRGEIALRVIRACRELGIEVVAVYSEADRGAPYLVSGRRSHLHRAGGRPRESYLKIPRIISAAEVADVQAIHPGYGFLSENAHFAEVCRDCKIEFIGPPHEAMHRLGNKNEARKLAEKAGVPVVPGSEGLDRRRGRGADVRARRSAIPVLIKAAAGGGGRGMRVARNDVSLQDRLQAASQEAENAFKDGSVYLEKIHRTAAPRRGADPRRPSRQRRPPLGARLLVAAPPSEARRGIAGPEPAAKRCARRSAPPPCAWSRRPATTTPAPASSWSTSNNRFYFIEVNARIQVEHPVTELVTGIDLVKRADSHRRRRAAALPPGGRDPPRRRHRVPHQRRGSRRRLPPVAGPDHALAAARRPRRAPRHARHAGYRVPPNYDSLVAKLLVHQPTRAEALACMRRALAEFVVEGIKTTIPLPAEIFDHPAFIAGQVDTTFIERTWQKG